MGTDLLIVHALFIASCVFFSYRAGQNAGCADAVEALLERGLLSAEELEREFDELE